MNIMDTIIWLVNFPVSHGYVMVFLAGFALFGLGALSFRSIGGASSKLQAVREREGLAEAPVRATGVTILARVQRAFFRALSLVMLAGLVLGILGLIGVPVTAAYIHQHGTPTTATVDGDWVTFTTSTGQEYTVESNFFTPSQYPDRHAYFSGDQVVVRYLPGHPQAFIIDSEQSAAQ